MSSHRISRIFIAAMAAAFATAASAAPLDDACLRIQQAYDHGDLDALEQVVRELDAAPNQDSDVQLVASLADYRIASAGQRDPAHLGPRIDAAIGRAESRLAPWADANSPLAARTKAEGLALLASTLGLHIGMDPGQDHVLGRKAADALRQAEILAPDDPRVALARDIQLMFLPPLFGGDRAKALQAFERVAVLIPQPQASATNWGLDDAWIWRGLALRSLQRPDDARAALRQALAIDPANGFAQSMLSDDSQVVGAFKANRDTSNSR